MQPVIPHEGLILGHTVTLEVQNRPVWISFLPLALIDRQYFAVSTWETWLFYH